MALGSKHGEVEGLEGGLRGGLLVSDGNGGVFVGPVPNPFGKELVPRDTIEELEDLQVFQPVPPDLLDEPTAVPGEAMVLYRASCHPRISSSVE
jgi:hypothetical protein